MAESIKLGPIGTSLHSLFNPERTGGPLGRLDQSDPNVTSLLGDTPGPLGFNDWADPFLQFRGILIASGGVCKAPDGMPIVVGSDQNAQTAASQSFVNQVAATPPTNQTGAFSSAQQTAALKESAKLYDTAVSPKNRCARYTYNLAYNYIKSLRGQPLHPITTYYTMLDAGGNANQQIYHNNLKLLGYSETLVTADCSKGTLNNLILSTQFNIGDVLAYWALDLISGINSKGEVMDMHYKYGHTQLYTAEAILPRNKWASDPKDNYGAPFVYINDTKFPSKHWALKMLRAPTS